MVGDESNTAATLPSPNPAVKGQTIFETLEAPMLKEISVEMVARFLSDRRKYGKEMDKKNMDDSVDITPASFLIWMSP